MGRCIQTRRSLFAGKLHAILCRDYAKGRGWYDLIWYMARRTSVNYALLEAALNKFGPWRGENVDPDRNWCVQQLLARIEKMDWSAVRPDVRRFVSYQELPSLDIWSTEFFKAQTVSCLDLDIEPDLGVNFARPPMRCRLQLDRLIHVCTMFWHRTRASDAASRAR